MRVIIRYKFVNNNTIRGEYVGELLHAEDTHAVPVVLRLTDMVRGTPLPVLLMMGVHRVSTLFKASVREGCEVDSCKGRNHNFIGQGSGFYPVNKLNC